MDVIVSSKCGLRFEPNDKQAVPRSYSDGSLIQLLLDGNGHYFLEAIDVERNKEIIFSIRIKRLDKYTFGSSVDQCDRLRLENGTYFLKFNKGPRDRFHNGLRMILPALTPEDEEQSKAGSKGTSDKNVSPGSLKSRDIEEENAILYNIHDLIKYIQTGQKERVSEPIRKLINKGVQLKAEDSKTLSDEKVFPIRIHIDGINPKIIGKCKEYSVGVYPSTKVHELRTLFQHVCGFPVDHQYFFVNSHLAYAESTMDELNVKEDSLFVLFLTVQTLN